MECSKDDVLAEVWQQLIHWLDHALNDTLLNAQYIDPGVQWSSSAPPTNWSPLLINTVKSWWQRPEAFTEIPNFYIAADYVRAPQVPFPFLNLQLRLSNDILAECGLHGDCGSGCAHCSQ
jgi:hypothetical protein